jgi:hypothetical protein
MSIWNEHLCNLFGGNKRRPLKQDEFKCPICGETVLFGEMRAHAAADNRRFQDGLVIARIKQDHPEWVEADDACPKCIEYYRQTVAVEKVRPRPHRNTERGTPPQTPS